MESHEMKQLLELVPGMDQYEKEIHVIEKILHDFHLHLQTEQAAVFWNHFISLFARLDHNEQNELECDEQFQASSEAKEAARALKMQLSAIRAFAITEFEEFLLLIYMEKLVEERNENHE